MTPLPHGFGVVIDPSVRLLRGGGLIVGGTPRRMLRLTEAGKRELASFLESSTGTAAVRSLARRLVDADIAHPRPPQSDSGQSVTVVIPVRDRPQMLERCLASLGGVTPVVVVDDGSRDADETAAICDSHAATLVRLPYGVGAAAARNAGLEAVQTDLVAFVDSDCIVPPGWLDRLTHHFSDPLVGAVAPRIVPVHPGAPPTVASRFLRYRCPLDMGEAEGLVGPQRRIPFVPTAALVVRREAVGCTFDPGLVYGEDVDLVWRLTDAGWTVRYVPDVTVGHEEPRGWFPMFRRRFRYGSSAAALANRHPGRLRHAVLSPWGIATTMLLLARRPRAALLVLTAQTALAAERSHRLGLPADEACSWAATTTGRSLVGVSHVSNMLAAPALVVALTSSRLRPGALAVFAASPLQEWVRLRPRLDPLRWVVACAADELAYGAGVAYGCAVHQNIEPITPTLA